MVTNELKNSISKIIAVHFFLETGKASENKSLHYYHYSYKMKIHEFIIFIIRVGSSYEKNQFYR